MVKDLVIVGSGGVDVVRLIEDINKDKKTYNFLGFLEEDKSKIGTDILGYPVLGDDDMLLDRFSHCVVINNVMHTPRIHERVTKKLVEKYHISEFPSLIHPAIDLRGVKIGYGNILYKMNSFGPKVQIGNFNIMYHASVGHESMVGDYNLIATSLIGSRCKVGSYNLIGNGTTLSNSVKLGDNNEVGVGSVVMKNYKDGYHLLGYPAIEMEEFVKRYITKKNSR